MAYAFELNSTTLGYRNVDVLADINLSLKRGEHVALLGKSGAGKTTLLSHLYRSQRENCALIPQNMALVEALSVFHNVYMGRLNQYSTLYNILNLFMPRAEQVERVRELLQSLGLAEKIFSATGALSGGQKQRVAIARAIFQEREILLGDEPISALDNLVALEVMQLLHSRHETVILAMHDVEMALQFASRIVGIKNGEIVIDHPAKNLSVSDLLFLYES